MRAESHHATFAASINMRKISTLIPLIACVLAGTCHAYQLVGTEALSEELIAQHYTINPNLDVVIVVDRTIPTFEYQTFYCAGSADEAEGQQGRIHFLEHIMSGTGSHGLGKLNQLVVENGGQKNAATSDHFTRFILRFPKDKLDLAVEIDLGRHYNTIINEEVVEHEKKIVLTERSRNVENINRQFTDYFFDLIYKKKQLSSIGTEAFIKQLAPDDLKAYYENFLRLQKRLIVIIGDVEVDHVLAKLDEAYGHEQTLTNRRTDWHAPQFLNRDVLGKKFKRTAKNLSVGKFRKSWYTPSLGHRDYAGLLILGRMLNNPSNSLRSSVVDSGLAHVFKVELIDYKGFGLTSCKADSPPDISVEGIKNAIQTKLEEIKTQGISEDEFTAAQNQQLKAMYSAFYNRSNMAYSFGRTFAHTDDPMLYPKLIRDMKSIRAEDIPRIIDQYLTDDNSITLSLTLEPKKSTPKKRTVLRSIIIVLESVGFLTLLVGLVALMVWVNKKLNQRLSRKAITDEMDAADERE